MKPSFPDPFSCILGADEELRGSAAYCFDNRGRGSAGDLAVQQTLAGAGFFEDAGGHRLVGEGEAMLFTHDEASAYGYPPTATAPYRLRYLTFRLGGLGLWLERIRAEFGAVVRMPAEGEASAILAEASRRFRERAFRDRFQETELLHQLLVAIYREQVAATQTHDPIEYGRHYLRDNFRSPLNLKEVAKRCGVSREHFIRSFGKRYGEPPGGLLRRLRLEQAHRMLRATQMPVQEVALACGFADANTFCRAYRLRYGTTPGSARQG
jgi:AraC-like DNA-binding protein